MFWLRAIHWNLTAATFVDDEIKYKNAKLAMDLGLATAIATGLGVYAVYNSKGKVAAASAIVTGVLLYTAYYLKLRSNPKVNGFMMGGNKTKKLSQDDTEINTELLSQWTPLSSEDIQRIRDIINSNPVRVVSNP